MAEEEAKESEAQETEPEIELAIGTEEESEDAVREGKEDEQAGDKEEQSEEDDKQAEEEPEKERVDFAAELERVKQELREEVGEKEPAKEEKKVYTKQELRDYRRQVEQKFDAGEITRGEYIGYIERLEDLNEERLRNEFETRTERKFSRTRAEENVRMWAEQNAPELLDKRTKASKESLEFGRRELGAVFEDGNMVLPESVGRVLLGLAKGTQSGEDVKKAEARGREQGRKERGVRDRDLGDTPPKGEQSNKKKRSPEYTTEEKEVSERLDLTPSAMKIFKRMRGKNDVEILQ